LKSLGINQPHDMTSLDYYAIEELLTDDERANAVARGQALGLRVLAMIRQR